jgi:DNA-directed RNA polymerase omega subunit
MPYVALETLVDKSCESVYKLVILASKRALEIAEGQPRLAQTSASIKPSTIALQEIAEGKVTCRKLKPKE